MATKKTTNGKASKIIYWIATIWLALGMLSTGIVQLIQMKEEVDKMNHLGYPLYLLSLIGTWKILGVIAVLLPYRYLGLPKFSIIQEWAYAGFFFAMSGAAISHIVVGNGMSEIFPSLLLLTLTVVSRYFRPEPAPVVLA